MGRKPNTERSDITKKSQPSKAKQKNEEYLKYQRYIRSKAFKEVKKYCEERDGGKCMVCGRTRQNGVTLTCHHRIYNHLYEGIPTESEDCVTLCSICHRACHSAKKNYEWFSRNNPRNRKEEDGTDTT